MAYKKSIETKKKIISASIKLFNEKGYYDTNIKDIAKEANIVHSSIYYYFKNKENIAREIFDNIIEKITKISLDIYKNKPDLLLNIMIKYILIFKFVALNKATQALYYDIVQYSDYDNENLERLKDTFFQEVKVLFKKYDVELSEKRLKAYILTSDAFAKALFKGIIRGSIDFTLKEAIDYFCRHMFIHDIKIPDDIYYSTLNEAFEICENITLN